MALNESVDTANKYYVINRLVISLSIGLITGVCCFLIRNQFYHGAGDFEWALRAARDILSGKDPYDYQYNGIDVPYPLTVAFIGFPFAWMPDELAAALFIGCSSFLLAYGILKQGEFWRLLIFLSPSYFYAMAFVQWSPLMVAMSFFPVFLFLLVIKPQIAVPMAFSGYVRWRLFAVIIVIALLLGSLVIMPNWPFEYLTHLGLYEGTIPILVVPAGGPLLLLSLLRWREPKGRLLLLMSLAPQRMFYDQLPLWLLPGSRNQIILLNITGWIGFYLFFFHFRSAWNWPVWIILSIYFPSLIMILKKISPSKTR
jgi:hypothetical protein